MAWDKMGNFHCCHVGCDEEADFIIKGNGGFEDYTHMCIKHKNLYANEEYLVKSIIRSVKE